MHPRATIVVLLALASACARNADRRPPSRDPAPVAAPSGQGQDDRLAAVDVFDTDPSTASRVLERHGDALRSLLRDDASDRAVQSLVNAIRADGAYVYVEPALVTYFQPPGRYLTIDIVSRQDAKRRMPFVAPPTGIYPDPEGLIESWQRYEATFLDLVVHGKIIGRSADCPAFHCLGDPQHPALRSLATKMSARVPAHVAELAAILRDDFRDTHRAAAAYLLAYATDGRRVIADLVPALHDPSSLVRNNAMRVLAEIALHHPELEVPIGPVVEALAFPATTDRNKAAAILERLVERPGAAALYPRVIQRAGATLLALLRLQQPNNHDFAYSILKTISGESYGGRDDAAWQAWLAQAGNR